jgi:hypothetical protein
VKKWLLPVVISHARYASAGAKRIRTSRRKPWLGLTGSDFLR